MGSKRQKFRYQQRWQVKNYRKNGVTIAEGNTLDEQIADDEERAETLRRIEQLEKQARTEKQPCWKWELAEEAKILKPTMDKEGTNRV
jgi:hypothetical protein